VGVTPHSGKKAPLDAKKTPTKVIAIAFPPGTAGVAVCLLAIAGRFPGAIVVVQHIRKASPEMFARAWMTSAPWESRRRSRGMFLLAGRVLICPGSRHIKVKTLAARRRRRTGAMNPDQRAPSFGRCACSKPGQEFGAKALRS